MKPKSFHEFCYNIFFYLFYSSRNTAQTSPDASHKSYGKHSLLVVSGSSFVLVYSGLYNFFSILFFYSRHCEIIPTATC